MDEIKKEIKVVKQKGDLHLTNRNWLFIKYYLDSHNAPQAYEKAGFKGKSFAAPYMMVNHLKSEIKKIAENSGVGTENLLIRTKTLIDRDIVRVTRDGNEVSSQGLTPGEHLKAIQIAHKLTDKQEKESQKISPVIIKTEQGGQTQVNIGGKSKGDHENAELEGNGTAARGHGEDEGTEEQGV